MKRLLPFLLLATSSFQAYASEFMEFGNKDFKSEKLKESRWKFEIGANYVKYPTKLPAFTGTEKTFQEEEEIPIVGSEIGFGREFQIGGGFSSTFTLHAFYTKSATKDSGIASKTVDLEMASSKTTHEVYGGDANLSINYLFENKVLNVQPFIEFGAGTGASNITGYYNYKGLTGSATTPNPETYDMSLKEKFNYAKSSIGVNFIAGLGFFSYLKVTAMAMNVSERELTGSYKVQSGATTTKDEKDTNANDSFSMTTASLGFGYLF